MNCGNRCINAVCGDEFDPQQGQVACILLIITVTHNLYARHFTATKSAMLSIAFCASCGATWPRCFRQRRLQCLDQLISPSRLRLCLVSARISIQVCTFCFENWALAAQKSKVRSDIFVFFIISSIAVLRINWKSYWYSTLHPTRAKL